MILKTIFKKSYDIPKHGKCLYWELDVKGYWVSIRYIPAKGFWGYCSCVAAQYRKPCKHLHFGIEAMKKEEGL
mgnify:CR=1 FL=1